MEAPNTIVVLAGGIKQDASGRWMSTDLTAEDDRLGASGGKLRVFAATILSNQHPAAVVVTSGGKGYDLPGNTQADQPVSAEILRDELIECGIPAPRIVLEKNSNTTYQQLQEIEKMIPERGWKNVLLITNRYHLPRLRAMIETKYPNLVEVMTSVSAEEVLIEADPMRWEAMIAATYAESFMTERIAKETQGVEQIKNGTYRFR